MGTTRWAWAYSPPDLGHLFEMLLDGDTFHPGVAPHLLQVLTLVPIALLQTVELCPHLGSHELCAVAPASLVEPVGEVTDVLGRVTETGHRRWHAGNGAWCSRDGPAGCWRRDRASHRALPVTSRPPHQRRSADRRQLGRERGVPSGACRTAHREPRRQVSSATPG